MANLPPTIWHFSKASSLLTSSRRYGHDECRFDAVVVVVGALRSPVPVMTLRNEDRDVVDIADITDAPSDGSVPSLTPKGPSDFSSGVAWKVAVQWDDDEVVG